jgi:hypothetical protein
MNTGQVQDGHLMQLTNTSWRIRCIFQMSHLLKGIVKELHGIYGRLWNCLKSRET